MNVALGAPPIWVPTAQTTPIRLFFAGLALSSIYPIFRDYDRATRFFLMDQPDSFQSTFSGNRTTKSRGVGSPSGKALQYAQLKVKQYVVQYFSEMTADSHISDDLVVLIVEPSLLSVTREVQPVKG
jgi:hypothetical protein